MTMIEKNGLQIESKLHDFIVTEALPGTSISEAAFYEGLADIVKEFAPKNRALLAVRDKMQAQLDAYHHENRSKPLDQAAYFKFLRQIGYLLPTPAPKQIETDNVDEEFASIAGPQLVVPMSNARYALNAANARWGSLYDALYGTDSISGRAWSRARPSVQPRAWRKGHRRSKGATRSRRAAATRQTCRCHRLSRRCRPLGRLHRDRRHRTGSCRPFRRLSRRSRAPTGVLLRTTACILKSSSIAPADWATIPRASQIFSSRRR